MVLPLSLPLSLSLFHSPPLVVVAEVTQPSLGVGVELGRVQLLKKKVLCLFRPQEGKSECGIFHFIIRFQVDF